MKLSQNTNEITFLSRNCPIEPFLVNTKKGPIIISELNPKEAQNAATFSVDCSVEALPQWRREYLYNPAKFRRENIEFFTKDYKKILKKDSDATILVGKTQKGSIKALFSLQKFYEFKHLNRKFADPKTAYIEECMVDSDYRGQGLGGVFINRLIETAKGRFSDVFLESENKAIDFYKRAGFNPLDIKNPKINKISNFILENRPDKEFITLMSKSLDPKNPWWQRLVKALK